MHSVYEYNVNKIGVEQFKKNRELAVDENFKSAREKTIELCPSEGDQQMQVS
jgi:hypothetical protein